MIEIQRLTKRFGAKRAIDGVSFVAQDGKVTGFLGPNGAGKSTTMRAALGLIRPDSGVALIDGRPFASMRSPLREVGAVLNPRSAHKGRTARAHLLALALSNGIPAKRVDQVMDIAGLASVGKTKTGAFSLGMSQRLSIAAALLGDPHNLILDEPVNGLDPEGVVWVRQLCRYYASQGRAVLLSSHLMSEVAQTADDLVIIGRGRVLERSSVADFLAKHSTRSVRIVTPEAGRLSALLDNATHGQAHVEALPAQSALPAGAQALRVTGIDLARLARLVATHQIVIYELAQERASLEEAYMALTRGSEEYRAGGLTWPGASAPGPGLGPGPSAGGPGAWAPGPTPGQGAALPGPGRGRHAAQPTAWTPLMQGPSAPVAPELGGAPGRGRSRGDARTMRQGVAQAPGRHRRPGPPVAANPVATSPGTPSSARHRKPQGQSLPGLVADPEAPAHYHVPPLPTAVTQTGIARPQTAWLQAAQGLRFGGVKSPNRLQEGGAR
ncbi:ATP-binding protein of ABC transporter system [Bifidobacterium actinocoloniiforme DSM 22766]|uniref:ATP-binding protein of ABC transporter system n=1 Tax=Bifidobacterium actinocoloniiforme DSM 22766 TaxID=1437605 RepID=A0A086YVW9_9BIFI|nr:ATP-binding protein of ABC transporter system [Bifidobacterium actinocoloniiforme DSM 22766]